MLCDQWDIGAGKAKTPPRPKFGTGKSRRMALWNETRTAAHTVLSMTRGLDDVRGEERGIEVSCHILLRVFTQLKSKGTEDALSLPGV